MLDITSQWQDREIWIFCYKSVLQKKIGRMLKPLVPMVCPDLSVRFKDITKNIAEKADEFPRQ